jgi:hypothetical protein
VFVGELNSLRARRKTALRRSARRLSNNYGPCWRPISVISGKTYEAAKVGKGGELETDHDGKMLTVRKQRAKLINDLPPEFRKLIEDVAVDRNGNVIPKLYSKAQANAELRKMLNIGRTEDRPENDVSRLSDAELIQQLADTAKELGIAINLNYSFLQRNKPDEEPQG